MSTSWELPVIFNQDCTCSIELISQNCENYKKRQLFEHILKLEDMLSIQQLLIYFYKDFEY